MHILDVIRGGVSVRGSPKLSSAIRALSWRDAYINQAEFCVPLDGNRVLRVRQLPNGEVNGFGTGLTVWPAACVLLKYLEHEFGYLNGRCVVELGCGTGAVGIAAALLGADCVVLTDQAQVQFLIHQNAQLNNVTQVVVDTYNWGSPLKGHLSREFDLVLVSDCILPKLYPIEPLVAAIDKLCSYRTTVLVSFEYRYFPAFDPKDRFWTSIQAAGLMIEVIPLHEHHPSYQVEDIEIWRIQRPLPKIY